MSHKRIYKHIIGVPLSPKRHPLFGPFSSALSANITFTGSVTGTMDGSEASGTAVIELQPAGTTKFIKVLEVPLSTFDAGLPLISIKKGDKLFVTCNVLGSFQGKALVYAEGYVPPASGPTGPTGPMTYDGTINFDGNYTYSGTY